MKKLIAITAVLWTVPAFAQTQAPPSVEVSGSITQGVQQLDNTTNSSKLTEYRDLRDSFYFPKVTFSVKDPRTGWFFDVNGTNVSRNDQTIVATGGRPGAWNLAVDWTGTPHNYSNKALTPYIRRGPGLFEVPATVPITFKKLATGSAADVPGLLASDDLVAAYQRTFLGPTPLGTQTNAGHFAAAWSGSDAIGLAIAFDRREKSGLKSTFGPIGDRPPRTLNIQLTEPVDNRTNEATFSAEHLGSGYQIRAEYLFSDFANRVDTLQWQNVFATPASGATFDAWDRSVSAYGARPLPPDNRYHNVSATFGGDLPLDSRLTATAAYGRLEQNETLLPYSYNSDQLAVKTLPRGTADARMNTLNFTADYVISPVRRLNVRAFYRRYDLNNDTPSSQWQYVTSDTSNLNGTVAYVNKRVNVPYAWDRQNAGADATWRLPGRSSLTFGYEREAIGRTHREADTTEDVLRATWRTRAAQWMSVEARYLQGMRDGGVYDNVVTREGYWYTQADGPDNNNPALAIGRPTQRVAKGRQNARNFDRGRAPYHVVVDVEICMTEAIPHSDDRRPRNRRRGAPRFRRNPAGRLAENLDGPDDRETQHEIGVHVLASAMVNHLEDRFSGFHHVLKTNAIVRSHTRLGPSAPLRRENVGSGRWGVGDRPYVR